MQLQVKGAPAFKEAKTPHTSTGSKGKTRPRAADPRRKAPQLRGPKPDPQDASALVPSAKGMILMRGHSDKGRRWHQEIDLELAVTLVKEHAAVVVNRRTIRRLYSNKDFRAYILTRDNYTCHFCGLYGDTIDHLLPRAKGGHTTPDNCVCACNLCNQTKADQYVEEFMGR
ncbi:HNH endonuclease [compost metagenome]